MHLTQNEAYSILLLCIFFFRLSSGHGQSPIVNKNTAPSYIMCKCVHDIAIAHLEPQYTDSIVQNSKNNREVNVLTCDISIDNSLVACTKYLHSQYTNYKCLLTNEYFLLVCLCITLYIIQKHVLWSCHLPISHGMIQISNRMHNNSNNNNCNRNATNRYDTQSWP